MYFWVLQRHTIHGEPELRKIAGEYNDRRCQLFASFLALWFWRRGVSVHSYLYSLAACCGMSCLAMRIALHVHVCRSIEALHGISASCLKTWSVPSLHVVQERTGEFEVSEREQWPTHRRIIGTRWAADWSLQKVCHGVSADGDKRVLNTQCRLGLKLDAV